MMDFQAMIGSRIPLENITQEEMDAAYQANKTEFWNAFEKIRENYKEDLNKQKNNT